MSVLSCPDGSSETDQLRRNMLDQLQRLVNQLADLEEYRDEMEPEEYEKTRIETKEQMEDMNETLAKVTSGNMSLVNELASMRAALQATISDAFKTPSVIDLFVKKQNGQLRQRLNEVELSHRTKKVDQSLYEDQKAEILIALQRLDEPLTPAETEFMEKYNAQSFGDLEAAGDTVDSGKVTFEALKGTL